ncbi:MAG: undecaprenyldiphospho-muramoylpentapeptide beta-N-acetylglucosaminyltransferase [Bacteroidia bacterium]|nr:undecaprenyldiphospho-muramoylpentapeptide beta-N-acetylglucosaminyltransferase [Bacteroidia bacterium]
MKQLKVIISGGGTGGHIFPAVAIANAIKTVYSNVDFLFVGAKGRMEMEKVPLAGYKIEGLWISGLQRKFTLSNLLFPIKIIASIIKAKKIFTTFQPDIAIGTGGYASGPMLQVAATKGIPTLIQEQNSYPGITNKILSAKVSKICVAYEGMEKYFPKEKIVITGNPIRKDITDITGKRNEAIRFFELDENKKTVLVIGGSLGAKTINESIKKLLPNINVSNIQLIWQTGKTYFPLAQEAANNYSDNKTIKVFDFISKMNMAYAAADVVISRAGAISLSELAVAGKASILIPSPNVAENHQTKNAMALVTTNAALMISDNDAREKLEQELMSLLNNESQIKQLENSIKKLAKPNAAEHIANEVLKLLNR